MSRTLLHLSDLHFGHIDPATLNPLTEIAQRMKPDLVVISGDLTQRARTQEFQAAKDFLTRLPKPQLVIPGNHDIPLYNLYDRFVGRLERYKQFITDDLHPFYRDDQIAVVGVNTARSLTFKNGRVSVSQMQMVRDRFCELDKSIVKVVVTHHPFDHPAGFDERDLVGRARLAMEHFADCGADLLLAGHLHVGHTGSTATRYPLRGRAALVVQAGTATSTRGRGEANSFNCLRIEADHLTVERWHWRHDTCDFMCERREVYVRCPAGWQLQGLNFSS